MKQIQSPFGDQSGKLSGVIAFGEFGDGAGLDIDDAEALARLVGGPKDDALSVRRPTGEAVATIAVGEFAQIGAIGSDEGNGGNDTSGAEEA